MAAVAANTCARDKRSGRLYLWVAGLFGLLASVMYPRDRLDRLRGRASGGDPSAEFQAYLDGYFNAFDLYPVCERHMFAKNDVYALLRDFWAVGNDLTSATLRALVSPARELTVDGRSRDELARRKTTAAQEAVRAIEESSRRSD